VNRRILAIWFPLLQAERIRRCTKNSAEPDDLPLVLAAKSENALRVFAVDRQAASLGLYPGLSLADARARVQPLRVVEADERADLKFLESIADWCDRFTPLVALDPPHGIILDISGCAHLFQGERAMVETIAGELSAFGLTARHAIAGTPAAARALARHASGTIAAPGEEEKFVSSLPVTVFAGEHAVAVALKRAGLKTIGEVAGRSWQELRARFGASFVFMLDQLLGKADSPISPRLPVPDYITEQCFPEPVATSEVIERTLFALSATMSKRLEERGKGARALEAAFFRTDGAVFRIGVETGRPLKEKQTIVKLFRERLDALKDPLDPGFGFDLIRLSAYRVENFIYEAASFDENAQDRHEISALIDRLSARYSAARVLRFRAEDTHIPECAAREIAAQEQQTADWQAIRAEHEPPRRPLRLLADPEPVSVIAEVPEGPPLRFTWRRAAHSIVRAEGPERIALRWWKENFANRTRDYFRVEDNEGRRYWLYREGLYGRETDRPHWFMHGLFA
jgi:protein ImuB